MYTTHFGFDSKPFKLKDPIDFYCNPNFDTACADILVGIRKRRGFILLTGEAGVGKTLLLRRCMARADDIHFDLLGGANLDFSNIIDHLCASLNLPAADSGSADERRRELLLKAVATRTRSNRSVALLVDDAQQATTEVLLQLQELVEIPEMQSQRLQVVLSALPDFTHRLDQPELHRLRDSIQVRCHLERLSQLETGLFIEHQLKVAGYAGQSLLPPAAIERIHYHCKGVPRTIGLLCDTVFLFASLHSEHAITPELVDTAAQTCFLADQPWLATRIESGQLGGTTAAETSPGFVAESADLDLAMSDFDFSFDHGEQTMEVRQPLQAPPAARITPSAAIVSPASPPSEARVAIAVAVAQEADTLPPDPDRQTADQGIAVISSPPPKSEILAFPLPESSSRVDRHRLDSVNVPSSRAQLALANELQMAVADHFPQTGPHLVAESAASRPSETLIGIGMPAPENHPRAANEPDTSEHLRSVAKKNPGLTRSFSSITEREKPMSRLDNLNKILKNLQNESPGVEASALISEDGLMIASALPQDLDETRVAGMTATLLNLGTRAAVELRRGDVREVIVRGEHGYSVMISAGRGALLLVLTNENSKLGLIFFDMREAIKAIRTIL